MKRQQISKSWRELDFSKEDWNRNLSMKMIKIQATIEAGEPLFVKELSVQCHCSGTYVRADIPKALTRLATQLRLGSQSFCLFSSLILALLSVSWRCFWQKKNAMHVFRYVDQLITSRFRNKVQNFRFALCFCVIAHARLDDIGRTILTGQKLASQRGCHQALPRFDFLKIVLREISLFFTSDDPVFLIRLSI